MGNSWKESGKMDIRDIYVWKRIKAKFWIHERTIEQGEGIIALKRERQCWERVLGHKALRASPGFLLTGIPLVIIPQRWSTAGLWRTSADISMYRIVIVREETLWHGNSPAPTNPYSHISHWRITVWAQLVSASDFIGVSW